MSQQAAMAMPAMGGPVGPIGANNPANNSNVSPDEYKRLNTYIYDYFMRNQNYACARVMYQESLPLGLQAKQSPNQRQPNGVDDMDQDGKDNPDRPKDLPLPDLPATGGHFLEDWWFQFWEIWNSRRFQSGKPSTISYITHQRQAQKARNGMMGTMDPSMQRNFSNMVNGAVMPADLKKAAMHNSGNMNPAMQAQMARVRAQQTPGMMAGNQMERSASQMDARSGSPGSGDAPSPKRQRVDGNMQAMSQRPVQPGQMPNNQGMPPNSAAAVAALSQVAAQGSPMSQVAMDGVMADFGPNGAMRAGMLPNAAAAAAAAAAVAQGGANNGSHALQDYQMQLMLLEQQNKKRLLMARQEQDGMTGHAGAPVANNGQFPPNMSPSGSRAGGPSPNPNDMQRGTPKMANGPSPNGNMTGRASPAPGVFDPNNVPAPLRNQMMAMGNAQNGQMGPRSMPQMPPQSQMEMFNRQAQGQMMPNGTFPGPQLPPGMMPGPQPGPGVQPGQTAPNMTPRQGNNPMPPPPAPQQNNAGGTQPSSPAPSAAPPTPSQSNKPKPGSKKDAKANKAAANKKGAAAATPASEADQAPTPTPQTPSAQMHAKAGQNPAIPNGAGPHPGNGPQVNGANHVGQPVQSQQPQPGSLQQQQDLGAAPFGGMDTGDQFSNMLDFAALDGNPGDVLENFDFDAFLNNTTDDNGLGGFSDHFNFDSVGGVEAGDAMGQ